MKYMNIIERNSVSLHFDEIPWREATSRHQPWTNQPRSSARRDLPSVRGSGASGPRTLGIRSDK